LKLLIATHNKGKLKEYEELFSDLGLTLTDPLSEGLTVEVRETGRTFTENAVLKARTYAAASGLLTLADDSGLEVEALGGGPGVLSARYGGPEADDQTRFELLLRRLDGMPTEDRRAQFRCVIALASPDGAVRTTEGICRGIIALEPRGQHGFGYDPVFYIPDYGCTMAELPPEIKNQISHRAQAAMKMKAILAQISRDRSA